MGAMCDFSVLHSVWLSGHGAGEMLQAFLQRAQVQGPRCLSDLKFFYSHLACLPWVTSCLVPNFLCHLGVISLSLSLSLFLLLTKTEEAPIICG